MKRTCQKIIRDDNKSQMFDNIDDIVLSCFGGLCKEMNDLLVFE